jgi:signal transduction histidine kinase
MLSNHAAAAPARRRRRRPPANLSAKILALAVAFLMLGEVLIFVPSVARFRLAYLEERLMAAHLATLSLEAAPDGELAPPLEARLLEDAKLLAIDLVREDGVERMLGPELAVGKIVDLEDRRPWLLIKDAFETIAMGQGRLLRVLGTPDNAPARRLSIVLDEAPLCDAIRAYAWRILLLSLILSAILATLLFLSLRIIVITPLRQITVALARFRERPEAAEPYSPGSARADEIGIVERELEEMRAQIRMALAEKTRLAALGAAVSQISHDLKNILSSAVLISDRLESSADPQVRRIAPRLVGALDRAVRLCTETLSFARDRPVPPRREAVPLATLIEEAREAALAGAEAVRLVNRLPRRLQVMGDKDQLYRVFLNLFRNSRQALDAGGTITVEARETEGALEILVRDDGPGIPESVLPDLYQSFRGSTRRDGSGLGLAICREIMAAHGGDVRLLETGPQGTTFILSLPAWSSRRPARKAVEV